MALALRAQGHMSPRKESAVRAVRREAHHLTRDVQQMYNEYISFDSKRDHFITTLNNVYAQLRKTRYLGKGPDIVTLDAVRSYVYFKGKVAVLRDFFSLLEKLANIRKKVRANIMPRLRKLVSSELKTVEDAFRRWGRVLQGDNDFLRSVTDAVLEHSLELRVKKENLGILNLLPEILTAGFDCRNAIARTFGDNVPIHVQLEIVTSPRKKKSTIPTLPRISTRDLDQQRDFKRTRDFGPSRREFPSRRDLGPRRDLATRRGVREDPPSTTSTEETVTTEEADRIFQTTLRQSKPRKATSSTKGQKKRAGKVSAKSQESRLEEELRMQAAVDREELAELREDVTAINNKLVRLSLEVGREFNRINRSLGELHAYVDEGLSGLVNDSGVDTDISAHAQQRHPFFVTQRYREVPKSRQSRHPTDEN
ncbi:Hypp7985 [Branchiostoma lanceolatum]|uniref:Hypp7985 protein n=1 Tax=Branchiostoma lanceolatum TaxID=7740 RepID=A0A8J9Z4Q9_BRALA|nr:Hypp7985 [Branchiostoma lanceolatum]